METQLEFIPYDELFRLMRSMLDKIPHPSNPHDRRAELLQRMESGSLSRQEAEELRSLIEEDLRQSNQEEAVRAIILIGLGILIGHALAKSR